MAFCNHVIIFIQSITITASKARNSYEQNLKEPINLINSLLRPQVMKSSENAFISCKENLEEQNKKCFRENCEPPQDYTNTKQNARKHVDEGCKN